MAIIKNMILLAMQLNLFDGNLQTNITTDGGLTKEMKTFYSDYLIDMAEPELVHQQFGQKKPIPKNGGKTIEFRKYDPLPKVLTPLTEGVTPDGQKLQMGTIEATVHQYGGYVALSDVLLLTAIDDNLMEAMRLLGGQAGRTLDTIVRDIITAGTVVQYADGRVSSRSALQGGKGVEGPNDYLTVDCIRRAVRQLKVMHAPRINGSYVAIIHPDCTYDLKNDPKWEAVKDYDPHDWYEGEIGRIEGVRFVETTEAKVFAGAGAAGRDVYATLVLGADAYGVTEVTGGGLRTIVKQLGSAGSADPLDQRATAGWKAILTAERLVEGYMVRIETCSTFTAA